MRSVMASLRIAVLVGLALLPVPVAAAPGDPAPPTAPEAPAPDDDPVTARMRAALERPVAPEPAAPTEPTAGPRLEWSGLVSSDVRYVVIPKSDLVAGTRQTLIDYGFARNDNVLKLKPTATLSPHVRAHANVDFVLRGFSEADTLGDLSRRERTDPFYLRTYALYVEVNEVLPGLDLRVGRQVVTWGASDAFSPLNVANARDFDNALLFGDPIGTDMLRIDYAPADWLRATAVAIPVFRPGLIPPSARLGLGTADRIRIQGDRFRRELAMLVALGPPKEITVAVERPVALAEDVAAGARVQTRVLDIDLAALYFRGHFDLPSPTRSVTSTADDGTRTTAVTLGFPRFQLAGLELSSELPFGPRPGLWADVALYFPEEARLSLETPGMFSGEIREAADGSLSLDGTGARPVVVPSRPFPKWTVGADVTLFHHLYVNLQWAHGFLDEYGSGLEVRRVAFGTSPEVTWDRIGDYLVAGGDLKLLSDQLLLRVFGIWKVGHATGIGFPQVSWLGWDGVDLSVGAFLLLGDENTKFGDPAAGGSQAFARATLSF